MTLAALVLAAGAGRRFGGGKLEAPFGGEPLLLHALRAACAAPVDRVILVAAPDLAAALPDPRIEVISLASDALSTSLKAGVARLGAVEGAFVFLGDMPLIPHGIAAELARLLPGHYAAQPRCGGQPGHPVLLSPQALGDVATLCGDEGAGRLLRARADVAFLDIADDAVLLDVDRAEDIARLEGKAAR